MMKLKQWSLIGVALTGLVAINAHADRTRACTVGAAFSNFQTDFVEQLQQDLTDGVPLANPEDKKSCAVQEQALSSATDDLSLVSSLFSNDAVELKNAYGSTCLNEFQNNEKVTRMEFYFRRLLCESRTFKPYVKSAEVQDRIRKAAKDMVTANGAYLKGGEKYDALNERMRSKAAEYRRANFCLNGVRANFELSEDVSFPVNRAATAKQARDEGEKIYREKMNEVTPVVDKWRENGNLFCRSLRYNGEPGRVVSAISYQDEAVTVKADQVMGPNDWVMKQDSADKMLSMIQNDPAIQANLKCGREISSIDVQASANKLRNSGAAAEKFGQWGFAELSQARLDSVKKQVLSRLKLPGFDGTNTDDFNTKVVGHLGERQSGSSGPCPYQLVKNGSGKFEVKPDPAITNDPKAKKEISESRFVRVVVHFKNDGFCHTEKTDLENQPYATRMWTDCLRVKYSCVGKEI